MRLSRVDVATATSRRDGTMSRFPRYSADALSYLLQLLLLQYDIYLCLQETKVVVTCVALVIQEP